MKEEKTTRKTMETMENREGDKTGEVQGRAG